jgi:hypothetical protein
MLRLSVSLFALVVAALASPALAQQAFDDDGARQMLGRLNALRAESGVAPLRPQDGLVQAARLHCTDMAQRGELGHVSPNTGTPADRARNEGVAAETIAENVALHETAAAAFEALVQSPAHRANMLSDAVTHIGIAALQTTSGVYVTQIFARIAEAEAPPVAVAPPPPPVAVERVEEPAVVEAPAAQAPVRVEIAPDPSGGPAAVQIEAVPTPAAPPAAAPPMIPGAVPNAPDATFTVQAGSNGTIVHQRTADGMRIVGYWIYSQGRWWWYPMIPGADPYQPLQLQVEHGVTGPPRGFPAHPFGPPAQAVQPRAWAAPAVPPVVPGGATVTIRPGVRVYSVPPPPMVGRPTRAYYRQQRAWRRAYHRWLRAEQRRQRALRRRAW